MIELIYVSITWHWDDEEERDKIVEPLRERLLREWKEKYAPPKIEVSRPGLSDMVDTRWWTRIVFDKRRHREKYLIFKDWICEEGQGQVDIFHQWGERKFSKQELMTAPLLHAVVGNANPLDLVENVYEYRHPPCLHCGFKGERIQIAPLRTDRGLRRIDVNWTHAAAKNAVGHEVVVSDRLKNLMEENKVTGVEFGPVYVGSRKVRLDEKTFQLKCTALIEPLRVPPTRANWEDQCPQCKRFKTASPWYTDEDGIRWHSLLYFPQSAWSGADVVCYDWNDWGYERSLIISQRLYHLLIEHRVRGFWCEPVYLMT